MRDDADFAAYLAARWPLLVRSLMLLGSEQPLAEEIARTGLARCYSVWDRVRKADDVDVYVYREVVASWHRSRRRRWWGEPPAELFPDPAWSEDPGDPTDAVLLRHALTGQLRGLTPEDREPLVLRFVAELTVTQVAEVLDVPIATASNRLAHALSVIDLVALEEVIR